MHKVIKFSFTFQVAEAFFGKYFLLWDFLRVFHTTVFVLAAKHECFCSLVSLSNWSFDEINETGVWSSRVKFPILKLFRLLFNCGFIGTAGLWMWTPHNTRERMFFHLRGLQCRILVHMGIQTRRTCSRYLHREWLDWIAKVHWWVFLPTYNCFKSW